MKAFGKNMVFLSRFLIVIFLLQSCSVYHSKAVSPERAVEADRKLKLKTTSNNVYKFKELGKDEQGFYGLAGKRSKAARAFTEDVVEDNNRGKFVKIAIPGDSIEEIRLRNKVLSRGLNIAGVTTALLLLITDRGPGHPLNLFSDDPE